MKKMSTVITAGLFAMLSASAFACPKGTTLQGGTGVNHKGGKCVAVSGTAKVAKKANSTTTKPSTEHNMAMPSTAKS